MIRLSPHQISRAYQLGAGALRRLPRPLADATGTFAALIWWQATPQRRAVVAANLARATGLVPGSPALRPIVRDAFRSYARYWIDSTRLDPTDDAWFATHFHLQGQEHLDAAIRANKGVILALPHLGSWEIGGLYGLQIHHPLTAVVEALEPPELLEWFIAQREAIGIHVLRLDRASAGSLVELLGAGGILALVADRNLAGDGIDVEFFGARTRFPAGPATLAIRTGAALLPCAIYQERGGVHRGQALPVLAAERTEAGLRADVKRVTQDLARIFEDLISAAPEQWHAFQPIWPTPER
jgi:phosphatidylinositol dimannoside acyltransferase